jgi:hypothetical protein
MAVPNLQRDEQKGYEYLLQMPVSSESFWAGNSHAVGGHD